MNEFYSKRLLKEDKEILTLTPLEWTRLQDGEYQSLTPIADQSGFVDKYGNKWVTMDTKTAHFFYKDVTVSDV